MSLCDLTILLVRYFRFGFGFSSSSSSTGITTGENGSYSIDDFRVLFEFDDFRVTLDDEDAIDSDGGDDPATTSCDVDDLVVRFNFSGDF